MPPRDFTDLEDEIIRRFAAGSLKVPVRDLEKMMRRTWSSIEKRAAALGLLVEKKKRSPRVHVAGISEMSKDMTNVTLPYSCTVGEEDLLLSKLMAVHPDRCKRYG